MVCLLGPRQWGKTTLARTLRPAYGYISLDDTDALALARSDPNGFMAALPDPVILDEIQRAPELLRTIKLSVDRDRRPGRFLLTGSANLLLLPKLGDSLAGRMTVLELHPPTAAELNRAGYVPDQSSRALHRLRTEADHPQRSLHENNKAVYSLLR